MRLLNSALTSQLASIVAMNMPQYKFIVVSCLFFVLPDEQSSAGLANTINSEREVCRNEVGVLAVLHYLLYSLVGEMRFPTASSANDPHGVLGIECPLVLLGYNSFRPF